VIEQGVIVSVALAAVGVIFQLGRFSSRLDALERDHERKHVENSRRFDRLEALLVGSDERH
jgi:hypothetical protein